LQSLLGLSASSSVFSKVGSKVHSHGSHDAESQPPGAGSASESGEDYHVELDSNKMIENSRTFSKAKRQKLLESDPQQAQFVKEQQLAVKRNELICAIDKEIKTLSLAGRNLSNLMKQKTYFTLCHKEKEDLNIERLEKMLDDASTMLNDTKERIESNSPNALESFIPEAEKGVCSIEGTMQAFNLGLDNMKLALSKTRKDKLKAAKSASVSTRVKPKDGEEAADAGRNSTLHGWPSQLMTRYERLNTGQATSMVLDLEQMPGGAADSPIMCTGDVNKAVLAFVKRRRIKLT
jgi:hypothetical protein